MNKGFAFSFNSLLALGVVLLTVFLLSVILTQISSENNFLHAKIHSLLNNDADFYSNTVSSDSLSGTVYCSVFLKYPDSLDYNPGVNLIKIKNCVMLNE